MIIAAEAPYDYLSRGKRFAREKSVCRGPNSFVSPESESGPEKVSMVGSRIIPLYEAQFPDWARTCTVIINISRALESDPTAKYFTRVPGSHRLDIHVPIRYTGCTGDGESVARQNICKRTENVPLILF